MSLAYSIRRNRIDNCNPEKASIDESFIDFSIPVRDELIRRFPHLKIVPPDSPQGIDTPLPPPPSSIEWPRNGNLIPIDPSKFDPSDKTLTIEQVIEAETGLLPTWHDVCLSIAAELMSRMRKAVFEKLGYYTTAVSFNDRQIDSSYCECRE